MKRITCQEAVRQFFAYLDRAISGESLERLEEHLRTCVDCCDKLEFSRQLDAFVKGRLADVPVPDGIEDRIRQRLTLLETKKA